MKNLLLPLLNRSVTFLVNFYREGLFAVWKISKDSDNSPELIDAIAALSSVHIELPGLLKCLSKCNQRCLRGFLLPEKSRASSKCKDAKKDKIFPKTKDTINLVENK